MIKKLILGLIIVTLISGLIFWINLRFDNDCLALSVFESTTIKDFFNAIVLLGFLGLILITGFVICYKLQKSRKVNLILYFTILSLIISIPNIKGIYTDCFDSNKNVKERICDKSTDDGMLCEFAELTFDEYIFITKDSWLPKIPNDSKNISVHYYRDNFLGDYNLIITIWIPEKSTGLIDSEDWIRTEEKVNGLIKLEYQKGKS